jgi:hypothetical protein
MQLSLTATSKVREGLEGRMVCVCGGGLEGPMVCVCVGGSGQTGGTVHTRSEQN